VNFNENFLIREAADARIGQGDLDIAAASGLLELPVMSFMAKPP
jgi:hypothetical protein